MDPWTELDIVQPIWESFFQVSPPVVVGTREGDGFARISRSRAFPFPAEFGK